MKIHAVTLCALLICTITPSKAQFSTEIQVGGSNFLGATANLSYTFAVMTSPNHTFVPTFGLGLVSENWFGSPGGIVHVGLNYAYNRFGGGVEASIFQSLKRFTPKAISKEIIVYPHLEYTMIQKSHFYIDVSAGAYFDYSLSPGLDGTGPYALNFSGDVIPGAGLTTGWKFYQ